MVPSMKNRTRVSIFTFAVLLLIIAAFPATNWSGWQFFASGHVHSVKWSLMALECVAAGAIGLIVWAVYPERGEK